jgi:uracil-DNA glycosylase
MPNRTPLPQWTAINKAIITCERCPRLRTYCQRIGQVQRAAYRDETYWAKPVPNLGDSSAHLLILGLAPGAHGANRTGRMFTGDKSGDFLFAAMYAEGFANQPTSRRHDDGLTLIDCAITATAHCAPPDNKPLPEELMNCRVHLDVTLDSMPAIHTGTGGILVLGKIAFDAAIALYKRRGWLKPGDPRIPFGHGVLQRFSSGPFLLCAYHPSQQNTFTGKLTQDMLKAIFRRARAELDQSRTPLNA